MTGGAGQVGSAATGPYPPGAREPAPLRSRPAVRPWRFAEDVGGLDAKRGLVPLLAFAVAIVAAVADPGTAGELVFLVVPVVAFAGWAYLPRRGPSPWPAAILVSCSVAAMVSVVLAQLSGGHEPVMFEISILALVVGCWCPPLSLALPLGLLAAMTPMVVYLAQDSGEVNVGIWILGILFPFVLGRTQARERRLSALLEDSRRELARQSLLDERRRIARDVHDLVGHGLAAVMLQVTSARHVLRRDPDAAEEALRSAEDVGRRSMRELRRTLTLLRADDEDSATAPPVSAAEVAVLVDDARAGGMTVDLRIRGSLVDLPAPVGVAVYRIAQEALANAARHAPRARTDLTLERTEDRVLVTATTVGPTVMAPEDDRVRPRYGLAGMRERARVLGGTLTAGPTPTGWQVNGALPLDSDDEPARAHLLTRTESLTRSESPTRSESLTRSEPPSVRSAGTPRGAPDEPSSGASGEAASDGGVRP